MSLVTGLLNKTCTVKRPVYTDDGAGGEQILSFTTVATGVEVLISQKTSFLINGEGGRTATQTLIGYFEYAGEDSLNTNDVITNITDAAGNVQNDVVNGVTTPSAYKLKSPNDPNLENDHLEFELDQVHGRAAGQP